MKLQLFICSVLKLLVQTSQEEGEKQLLETEEFVFNESIFSLFYNSTIPADEGEPAPTCSVHVPGFNSMGLTIAFIIVFVFSMVGNSVVVYVVCCMKKCRASTDIYLMHLAMADLLFSVTLPFWAVDVRSGWIFGNVLCKLVSGFKEASVYTSVFLLACISVDRYFAIVRATRVLSRHHLLVNVVCFVVWLVAGLLSLPVAIQRESMQAQDLGQTICFENLIGESSDHWRLTLRVLRHTVGFFLPLVVMAVGYSLTVATLLHAQNQQKYKAMHIILAVVLAFILCWLPFNITVLIDTLIQGGILRVETCDTRYRMTVILKLTEVLAFMHCAVNPVLYAFIGEKFRNQLLTILYKHGLISKRLETVYRKRCVSSAGSIRSRSTSVMM